MELWMLCVTLNLLDPSYPVVCEHKPSHAACTGAAQTWRTGAEGWKRRSQISVSIVAACWPVKQELLATKGEVHVHL